MVSKDGSEEENPRKRTSRSPFPGIRRISVMSYVQNMFHILIQSEKLEIHEVQDKSQMRCSHAQHASGFVQRDAKAIHGCYSGTEKLILADAKKHYLATARGPPSRLTSLPVQWQEVTLEKGKKALGQIRLVAAAVLFDTKTDPSFGSLSTFVSFQE